MAKLESVLLIAFADRGSALAARLLPVGYRALRAADPAEAAERAAADPALRVGLLPTSLAEPARAALEARREDLPAALVLTGPPPAEPERVRWRAAGVEHLLCEPYDDHELRFVLNRAGHRAQGGAPRRELRVPATFNVRVLSGTGTKAAVVYNLSVGGAYLETPRPTMVGGTIRLELPLGATPITVNAEVVSNNVPGNLQRSSAPVGMGVRFTDLGEPERRALTGFVEERAARYRL